MRNYSTSFLVVILIPLLLLPNFILGQCPGTGCTYTITGSDSGSYTVNTGEKICFDAGANFTGSVNLYGGELINCATAPQTFTVNTSASSPDAVLNNYGTITYTTSQNYSNGLTVNNHDTINYTDLSINSPAYLNNYNTINISSYLNVFGSLNNDSEFMIGGDLNTGNSSTLDNAGNLVANTIDISNDWTNSGTMTSNGYTELKTSSTGSIEGGCLTTNTFTNRGSINGAICGDITVNTLSTNASGATLTGDIAFIDLTPPGSAPFIDNQNGTVAPSIQWTSCNDCGPQEEICNNTIDDNGDGRIDEPYPGGIQTNMQLWLKAETGTNTTIDGNDVTAWADQSVNGYSANADVNSTDDPIYLENALNYNPGIDFDGTYTDDFSDGLHLGSDYIYSTNNGLHIFAVVNAAAGGTQYDKVYDFGGVVNDGYSLGWSNNSTRSTTPGSYGGASSFLNHFTGPAPSLLEFEIKFNDNQTVFQDGATVVTNPITLSQLTAAEIAESDHYGTAANGDHTSGPVSIGRKSASRYLDQNRVFMGSISEVLVYNDTLTQIEKERIQSYLALKYGMTMPHDYTASSGTTIKDITDGYANGIFAIGRDDCSGLDQKQSKSVSNENILSIAVNGHSATNAAHPNSLVVDESFLVIGHDNAAANATWTATNNNYQSLDRVWKMDKINYNQDTEFSLSVDNPNFDLPAMPANADGQYYVLFGFDADFTTGSIFPVALSNFDGNMTYSESFGLPALGYFTFGVLIPQDEICGNSLDDNSDGRIDEVFPGGVQQDMQLWLKAETGTNTNVDGNDITSWSDQSVNGYSADADVNSTDDPTFSENAINFNPGIDFDGVYTDGYSDGLHLGSDYIYGEKDGVHVFVVCDPDVAASTDKYVFDFGLQANGGYGMIYSDNDYGMYTNNMSGGTNTELFHSEGEDPALVEMKIDFDDSQAFYRNGDLLSAPVAVTIPDLDETKVNEAPAYGPLGTTTGPVSIGRKSASVFLDLNGGRLFDGRISEVIVFTDTLSSFEKQQVNGYLAVKYGLTINQDYVSSSGSIKKDISDGYANDIAGLGRDDCSGLHQKQSKSINSDAIFTIGKGTIAATNQLNGNSISADGTYLMWGNNDAAANANWVTANVSIPGVDLSSIDRTWSLTETFDVTNTLFQVAVDHPNFDLPAMPPTADGTYYLLRDDDGDFTNGGTTYEPMSLVAGDVWETMIADPTSEYFTIAVGNTCGAMAPVLAK